jgi:hypothetical protein
MSLQDLSNDPRGNHPGKTALDTIKFGYSRILALLIEIMSMIWLRTLPRGCEKIIAFSLQDMIIRGFLIAQQLHNLGSIQSTRRYTR